MIINALKPCCYSCDYPDIEVDERGDPNIFLHVCISCAHDKVCKYYNESKKDENT